MNMKQLFNALAAAIFSMVLVISMIKYPDWLPANYWSFIILIAIWAAMGAVIVAFQVRSYFGGSLLSDKDEDHILLYRSARKAWFLEVVLPGAVGCSMCAASGIAIYGSSAMDQPPTAVVACLITILALAASSYVCGAFIGTLLRFLTLPQSGQTCR